MGALTPAHWDELNQLSNRIVDFLGEQFGGAVAFEHGPRTKGCSTGCSVDYAHTHVVPLAQPLFPFARKASGTGIWSNGSLPEARNAHVHGQSYLYLRDLDGSARVCVSADDFPSQCLRKSVAAAIGYSRSSDWKIEPNLENVQATIDLFIERF
jgi:hypothetical protein